MAVNGNNEEYFVVRSSDEKVICRMRPSEGERYIFYTERGLLVWDKFGNDALILTPETLEAIMENAGYKGVLP